MTDHDHDFTAQKVSVDGCDDCVSSVTAMVAQSGVSGGPVLVVQVEHAATCPWFNAMSPGGAEWSTPIGPYRVNRHVRADR